MSEVTFDSVCAALFAEAEASEGTTLNLSPVGTYAAQYAEVTNLSGETVESFLHGSEVMSLIVQEAIVRVMTATVEAVREEPITNPEDIAFTEGIKNGLLLLVQTLHATADGAMRSIVEEACIDRAFNSIVGI